MTEQHPTWPASPAAAIHADSLAAARAHQAQLTKPAGSLGMLETIAIRLAGMQGRAKPSLERVQITLFAGDHGVVEQGVSTFPQAVTAQMVHNIATGGAAISVLARALDAELEVVDLGCATPLNDLPESVHRIHLGPGTADMTVEPAMSMQQLEGAFAAGVASVERARARGATLFIGGEMGIGNTTAASAVACAILGESPEHLAGPGTGLDAKGVSHKAAVIARALSLHSAAIGDPLSALRHLGGFELAALASAYRMCSVVGLPVLVDGFIASAAALAAVRMAPATADWLFYAHTSAESGHRRVLAALDAHPLVNLEMRLGEGSGAAVAVPIMRLACALHGGMARFEDAGVARATTESGR